MLGVVIITVAVKWICHINQGLQPAGKLSIQPAT